MTKTTSTSDISVLDAAKKLASENIKYEPKLIRIYRFPSNKEIRLVEIDPNTLPVKRVTPYYFRADPVGGYPYPIAMSLITPEDEAKRIPLPRGWGKWEDAEVIWEKTVQEDG